MIHTFPSNTANLPEEGFTNPFRYSPHPLVKEAAAILMRTIEESEDLSHAFSEGKMLGILVCSRQHAPSVPVFIAAFSGLADGRSMIPGFVPPVFDFNRPDGYFRMKEAEISALNIKIAEVERCDHMPARDILKDLEERRDKELMIFRKQMEVSRIRRESIRGSSPDRETLERLTRESQHEKAEFRRLKQKWKSAVAEAAETASKAEEMVLELKSLRTSMSEELQEWLFRQYIVHNAEGAQSTILDIFAAKGLIPPGGTGECAAPKLLEYAYRNGLHPIAMGEFWYGASPSTAVRTHGHFYPSCTSKCGPLLEFMTAGLHIQDDVSCDLQPEIIHEDEYIVAVSKPSGMPSVPGLDGRKSAQQWLREKYGDSAHIEAVHRLDMDTSGLIIFAKDEKSAVDLRRQFEERQIEKEYIALLSSADQSRKLEKGEKGIIAIPLSPDYDERPRQKADRSQGKEAITSFEVRDIFPDGTVEIIFRPRTGRTHQLRVHSAHTLGLGRPIVGDMLYGGDPSTRLHLHALRLGFIHPVTGAEIRLESTSHRWIKASCASYAKGPAPHTLYR